MGSGSHSQADSHLLADELIVFHGMKDGRNGRGGAEKIRAGDLILVEGEKDGDPHDWKVECLTALMLPVGRSGMGNVWR